jgi:hypothetical protein
LRGSGSGAVIADARKQLAPGERLRLNPTSGTKQMTAGATAAALVAAVNGDDCEIVFTTGERADGVVKTGTERISAFDAAPYLRERDFALADEFFRQGAFFAAAKVLRRHSTEFHTQLAAAETCHHWQRFDYEPAAGAAARFNAALATDLRNRARSPQGVLSDLLAWADFALRHNAPDDAVRLAYKSLEHAARLRLELATVGRADTAGGGVKPNADGFYRRADIEALRTTFVCDANKPTVALGLKNLVTILRDLDDPFGVNFDGRLFNLADVRNAATHTIRPAAQADAQSFLQRARNLTGATPTPLPTRLPPPA